MWLKSLLMKKISNKFNLSVFLLFVGLSLISFYIIDLIHTEHNTTLVSNIKEKLRTELSYTQKIMQRDLESKNNLMLNFIAKFAPDYYLAFDFETLHLIEDISKSDQEIENVTFFDSEKKSIKNDGTMLAEGDYALVQAIETDGDTIGYVGIRNNTSLIDHDVAAISKRLTESIAEINSLNADAKEKFSFLMIFLEVIKLLLIIMTIALLFKLIVHTGMKQTVNQANNIAAGDFDTPIVVARADELGILQEKLEYMRQRISDFTHNLQSIIEEKTQEILKSKNSLKTVLDHLPVGLLKIDGDLKATGEFSKITKGILLTPKVEGVDVSDLLFQKARLKKEQQSMQVSALTFCFGQSIINFELNEDALVKELVLDYGGHQKIIELSWSYIKDETNLIESIIVILQDKTEITILNQRAQQESEKIMIISNILALPQNKLPYVFKYLIGTIHALKKLTIANLDDKNVILKELHTLKGNSRIYGLDTLSQKIHDTESLLIEDHDLPELKRVFSQELERIEEIVGKNYRTAKMIYPSVFKGEEIKNFEITKPIIEKIKDIKDKLDHKNAVPIQPVMAVLNYLLLQNSRPINVCLKKLEESLLAIAEKLNKPCPKVVYRGDDIFPFSENEVILESIFSHLFKNTVDHSMESGPERLASSKTSNGEITITSTVLGEAIEFIYEDDGRGLNLEKIKEKASQFLDGDESKVLNNPQKVAEQIFKPQLSTSSLVTEISGRGVGMAAVYSLLKDHGGTINLIVPENQPISHMCPFKARIVLPKNLFYTDAELSSPLQKPA